MHKTKIATASAAVALLATTAVAGGATLAQAEDLPRTAFGSVAQDQPENVKTGTAKGDFHAEGTVLIGPDGKQFIPQGINAGVKGHADWGGTNAETRAGNLWGRGDIKGHAKETKEWGFNTVRANLYVTNALKTNMISEVGYDKFMVYVDDLVKEYANQGIVLLLDIHDEIVWRNEGSAEANAAKTASVRAQIDKFLVDAGSRYKNNPYVWIGMANELKVDNKIVDGAEKFEWTQYHDHVIELTRKTGFNGIISVNAPAWAQDYGPASRRAFAPEAMPYLNTKEYDNGAGGKIKGNLLTEYHAYGGDCAERMFNNPAAMMTYVNKTYNASGVVGGGTPIFIGEFGYDINDSRPVEPPNPKFPWGDTGITTPTGEAGTKKWVCSFDMNKSASNTIFDVAKAQGIGFTFWNATFGGDGRTFKKTQHAFWDDGGSGVGLTEQGKRMWDLTHSAKLDKLALTNVDGGVHISTTATDNDSATDNTDSGGIKRVDFYVNDAKVATVNGNVDGSINELYAKTVVSNIAKGSNVKALAYDTAGNVTKLTASYDGESVVSVTPTVTAGGTSATTFSFNSTLPKGAKLKVTWTRDNVAQAFIGSNPSFWSGTQTGWSNAQAFVIGADGTVLAKSAVVNPPIPAPVATGYNATTFGFKAEKLPVGGKLKVTWTRGGVAQSNTGTNPSFWSGTQTGWANAQAFILDADGTVVAKSAVINP